MTFQPWTVGDVRVFSIVEVEAGEIIQNIIRRATPESIRAIPWLAPHFADEHGHLRALVQAFLIQSEGKNILIDTCNGNGKIRTDLPQWANLRTDFLKKLADLNVAPADVDIVACTHLHMDHVGWNTVLEGGVWVPTFPNATYLFAKKEYEYWVQKPEKEIADDKASFDDSVHPIVNAGLAQLVTADHAIGRQVRFIPTPGHTPAHVSVVIDSQGQRAVISGDFLHHPCQIAHPEWTSADTFTDQATETRQKTLQAIADSDSLLIGSHFANPVVGRVVRRESGFVFKASNGF